MRLSIKNGGVPPKTIFRLVTVGFSVSSLILFAPFFLIGTILLSIGSPSPTFWVIVTTIVVLPIILVAQAALLGLLVNFGLHVYGRFRPVTYEHE